MGWGWYLIIGALILGLAITIVEITTWAAWKTLERSSNEKMRFRGERLQEWRLRHVRPRHWWDD